MLRREFVSSSAARGSTQFLLCCLIAGNFMFAACAVGREPCTDASKKGELNMIHSSADRTNDRPSSCSLKKEKWGNNFKLHEDSFQLCIKEKLLTIETNPCPGEGFFTQATFLSLWELGGGRAAADYRERNNTDDGPQILTVCSHGTV